MQCYLFTVGPGPIDGGVLAVATGNFLPSPLIFHRRPHRDRNFSRNRPADCRSNPVVASAALYGNQDHYAVLGLPSTSSSADIKRAYRHLALKYHPDVCKHSQASEVFKSIRLAFDVLSNEATRAQYDRELKFQETTKWKGNWKCNAEFEENEMIYRWTEIRRRMRCEKYRQQYDASEEDSSSDSEMDEMYNEKASEDERGTFSEVLRSAFFTLFLMKTIGHGLSLTLCSLNALLDKKLDTGYKMGYLIAWFMGGRGGILLTLCLSFASWVCGKTSSSLVALVVFAMWVGANLTRHAPIPQGALVTLLYMSVKLQVDLN